MITPEQNRRLFKLAHEWVRSTDALRIAFNEPSHAAELAAAEANRAAGDAFIDALAEVTDYSRGRVS